MIHRHLRTPRPELPLTLRNLSQILSFFLREVVTHDRAHSTLRHRRPDFPSLKQTGKTIAVRLLARPMRPRRAREPAPSRYSHAGTLVEQAAADIFAQRTMPNGTMLPQVFEPAVQFIFVQEPHVKQALPAQSTRSSKKIQNDLCALAGSTSWGRKGDRHAEKTRKGNSDATTRYSCAVKTPFTPVIAPLYSAPTMILRAACRRSSQIFLTSTIRFHC